MPNQAAAALAKSRTSGFGIWFIALCLMVYLLNAGAAILIPFVIAVFVWYLINALARFLRRIPFGRNGLPAFVRFVLSIGILATGVWFGYKLISANAAAIMAAAPGYQARFLEALPNLMADIPEQYRPAPGEIAKYLDVGGFITTMVKTFSGVAGKLLVVLFYTGFLLYEQKYFGHKLHELTGSDRVEKRVHHVLRNIDIKVQRYIGVRTFISLMVGISTWLVLMPFHVDFAAFWGIMAFVLNYIPYFGSVAAVLMPSIIALAQTGDPSIVIMVAGVLAVVHIFWSNIVDPRLMGDSLNLSPIFIIFSLAGWGMVWGVPGMFLSVPILSIIAIVTAQFEKTRPFAVLVSKTGVIDSADVPEEKPARKKS